MRGSRAEARPRLRRAETPLDEYRNRHLLAPEDEALNKAFCWAGRRLRADWTTACSIPPAHAKPRPDSPQRLQVACRGRHRTRCCGLAGGGAPEDPPDAQGAPGSGVLHRRGGHHLGQKADLAAGRRGDDCAPDWAEVAGGLVLSGGSIGRHLIALSNYGQTAECRNAPANGSSGGCASPRDCGQQGLVDLHAGDGDHDLRDDRSRHCSLPGRGPEGHACPAWQSWGAGLSRDHTVGLASACAIRCRTSSTVLSLPQLLGDRSLIWRRHYREGAYVAG